MNDTLEVLNQDFKSALKWESEADKFKALENVAKETNSADIPEFLKARILNSVREHQFNIVGHLDSDLNSCFIV